MTSEEHNFRLGKTGLLRLWYALKNSKNGFSRAFASEAALRQEVLLLVVLVPVVFWLSTDKIERLLLIASVVLVIIVELLNTAIEAVVDRIGPEHHTLSGLAKDVASCAVLISLLLAVLVWLVVLL